MTFGYDEFKKEVYSMTKIDLNLYKERQMKRRIDSLIDRNGFSNYSDFIKGMKQDAVLLRTFVGYITINVSQFYRNPGQWELFEKDILPELIKSFGEKLTIWSAACSTGDEPYTIAMIASKYISLSKIKIYATDIDDDVLAFAAKGEYTKQSLVDLPEQYLNNNFTKLTDGRFKINDNIKKCVEFKKHNLLKDQYFNGVNLIVCRNVVIYFTDEAKSLVYKKFNEALTKNGVLFIGSTETIVNSKDLNFSTLRTFFYRKDN